MNKYVVLLSGENLNLATAELFALHPLLKLIDSDKNKILVSGRLNRLHETALVKEAFIISEGKHHVDFSGRQFDCKRIFIQNTIWENSHAPATLPAKLSRVMVNLAAVPRSMEIVDPFCGSGSILLEAAKLGHPVIGYDIDKKAVAAAQQKLSSFKSTVKSQDACTLTQKFKAIVTDLPYGKSTSVNSLISLYILFLMHMKPLTEKLVIGFPHFVSGTILAQKTGYVVHAAYRWHIHSSLFRDILVLDSRQSPFSAQKSKSAGTSKI